jgi:iron(III) transport system permease protein
LQLLAVVLVVLALERRFRSDQTVEGEGPGGSTDTVSLGRFRWPATLLPATVATLALAVPLCILGLWLFEAESGRRPSLAFEWSYAVNSITVALAAAVVAAIVALPVGYLAARDDSWLVSVIERTTYVGFAVPGIVLGLALIYFSTRNAQLVYQTIPLLVFAYVIRFLPQAVGTIRTTTLNVDPHLVEAARTLGERPFGAFRRVTLRLIAPGVTAGAALVFLTAMKELPATLLLRPTGFETIVTQIWKAQSAAYYQYAAVPALILLLVSGLSMLVLLRQENYAV